MKKSFQILSLLVVIFLSAFVVGFSGNIVKNWWGYGSFNIDYLANTTNSAVYGLCVIFAVIVTLSAIYLAQHYIWPAMKFVGLKIRFFFHDD